uniref:Uncharacterized protein n=1 Tax=Arundo donax TaxID=35708 RepID=A0A0A9HJ19_ARUDO
MHITGSLNLISNTPLLEQNIMYGEEIDKESTQWNTLKNFCSFQFSPRFSSYLSLSAWYSQYMF